MKTMKISTFFTLLLLVFFSVGCKKKDGPPAMLATVSTGVPVDFTSHSVRISGTIVNDGNTGIIKAGFVYSTQQTSPTLENADTVVAVLSGADFSSTLEGLSSSSSYHIRAYATNSVGTAYGEVVSFETGNAAPVAANVTITGPVEVDGILTASYTYTDAEGDPQAGSSIQWYRASDNSGTGETAIAGATEATYRLMPEDEFKFIRVAISVSATTGSTSGSPVKSAFTAAVSDAPTTVTFSYNNATVTYGIIVSPITGRRWLDRNLGAPSAPKSYDDYANYGDLFQWGRAADGHQLIKRGADDASTTAVNGITDVKSTTDAPGNSLFITASGASPLDWRASLNNTLWQVPGRINNPCPPNFHIPSAAEWEAENKNGDLSTVQTAYTMLKITWGGFRITNGSLINTTSQGTYWTTDLQANSDGGIKITLFVKFDIGSIFSSVHRAQAMSCRCIKD